MITTLSFRAFLLFFYVCMSCFGLLFMKKADNLLTPTFFLGFGLYGIGFLIWLGILRQMSLSVAFPIAAGALVLGSVFMGIYFLNEQMQISQFIGIACIILGIALVYLTGESCKW